MAWQFLCWKYKIIKLHISSRKRRYGIPVCILVLKKCKKEDDVLFINASEYYEKVGRLNRLKEGEDGEPNDIQKIV